MTVFQQAICLCVIFSRLLYSGLENHLKKAEGKTDAHSFQNIDFIYMINLDERPEKFTLASSQLHCHGIYPYRFSAVNGWKLSTEVINDVGLKYKKGMTQLMATTFLEDAPGPQQNSHEFMTEEGKTYFCHCMSRGAIGCALSHISILQDAWDSGYETIWVLEDDIEVLEDPRVIPELIDKLDNLVGKGGWDVLFTDQNYRKSPGQYITASGAAKRPDMDCSVQERYSEKYTVNRDVSVDFRRISARFATHSMIIRRSGIEKLLNFSKTHQIYLPYDMENYFPKGIARYSFTRDIVTNMCDALSDNGKPFYEDR